MENSLILTSYFFGSIVIFTTSLNLLNKTMHENPPKNSLIMLNGTLILISGSAYVYGITQFLKKFKY